MITIELHRDDFEHHDDDADDTDDDANGGDGDDGERTLLRTVLHSHILFLSKPGSEIARLTTKDCRADQPSSTVLMPRFSYVLSRQLLCIFHSNLARDKLGQKRVTHIGESARFIRIVED